MLRSLTLKNFRCFENFTIEPLERVNLIGGKNNVGKTSLLEAIFIFTNPNNPNSLLKVNRLWDLPIFHTGQFDNMEDMRGYFFNQDMKNDIIIKSSLENDIKASLNIRLIEPETEELESNELSYAQTTLVEPSDILHLKYKENSTDESNISGITLKYDGKFSIHRDRKYHGKPSLLINSTSFKENTPEYYSNLERVGCQKEVLESLRLLEPRLKRLSLLIMKNKPIIYGDIGMSELVPLPLMGEGMGRLLSIVLAIANAKGGTVLIDEIENGLHYSVLVNVWKAIADAARRADVQIFATSHSRECILAAHEAFKNSDNYDFRYHRLDRVKDEIKAFTYDQEALETSDDLNWEIR